LYIIKATGESIIFNDLIKIAALEQERLKKLSNIIALTDLFFVSELKYEPELLIWKDMSKEELIKSLEISKEILTNIDPADFNKKRLEEELMPVAEKWIIAEIYSGR